MQQLLEIALIAQVVVTGAETDGDPQGLAGALAREVAHAHLAEGVDQLFEQAVADHRIPVKHHALFLVGRGQLFQPLDQRPGVDITCSRPGRFPVQRAVERGVVAVEVHQEKAFADLFVTHLQQRAPLTQAAVDGGQVGLTQLVWLAATQQQRLQVGCVDGAVAVRFVRHRDSGQLLSFRQCVELVQIQPAVQFNRSVELEGLQQLQSGKTYGAMNGFTHQAGGVYFANAVALLHGLDGGDGVGGSCQGIEGIGELRQLARLFRHDQRLFEEPFGKAGGSHQQAGPQCLGYTEAQFGSHLDAVELSQRSLQLLGYLAGIGNG